MGISDHDLSRYPKWLRDEIKPKSTIGFEERCQFEKNLQMVYTNRRTDYQNDVLFRLTIDRIRADYLIRDIEDDLKAKMVEMDMRINQMERALTQMMEVVAIHHMVSHEKVKKSSRKRNRK